MFGMNGGGGGGALGMIGPGIGGATDMFGLSQENPVMYGKGIETGPEYVGALQTPGLRQGSPVQGDWDMRAPGAAEAYQAQMLQNWQQPGMGAQWWMQNRNRAGGDPNTTQHADQYYRDWQDRGENLDADMGAYYDRAKERSVADIDKSFGARGMFGSSAATGQIGETVADLEAQRARDEAEYGLKRAAEQRGWSGLGGSLAGQADQSNLANEQAALARLMGAGSMAAGFDAADLARLNAGMNAAAGAQDARRMRAQDMFQNTSAPALAMFGMQQEYMPQMLANDQALMDSSIMFGTGMAQDMINSDRYATEKWRDDDRHAMDMFGSFMGGMMG